MRFGQTSHIIYEVELIKRDLNDEKSFDGINDDRHTSIDIGINAKNQTILHSKERVRRYIASSTSRKIPHVLFVETAIFVDKDLFRHMAKNYPKNTEGNLIRFVMAMINGV